MAENLLSREYTDSLRENDAADARWLLAERVGRALSEAGPDGALGTRERVMRLAVPAGRINPFRWLREQALFPKTYWAGRGERTGIAAVGAADIRVEGVSRGERSLSALLAALPDMEDSGARYYGGARFDALREPDSEWAPFAAYYFVLPRFELHVGDSETTLICNLVLPRDVHNGPEIREQIEDLSLPGGALGASLPIPVRREDSPDFRGWERNIERALRAFSEGRLGKVVLARRAKIGFGGELDATLLLESLKEATPDCFHFYTEPEAGVAFLGASPERLFSREGNLVVSEAVAGTRPRGLSSEDDDGLREDLMHSAKDRSEHTYVRTGIEEALAPLCEELNLDGEVVEMKLARGRHLKSMVRGTLKEGVTDAGLLEALHPTPAVGGHPRDGALAEIRDLEPFDRGLYAGPVGWFGAGASEFAVGIRSGLVRGRTLDLYSGAGIVAGSVPDEEWAEIENKISDFTGMFGLEQGNAAS
ncbi:MAG TPA: isochorismate synthase [Rubrobacter sp.]|nr:isochorismate synthase [Rubrobacter sp.]